MVPDHSDISSGLILPQGNFQFEGNRKNYQKGKLDHSCS